MASTVNPFVQHHVEVISRPMLPLSCTHVQITTLQHTIDEGVQSVSVPVLIENLRPYPGAASSHHSLLELSNNFEELCNDMSLKIGMYRIYPDTFTQFP